MSKKDKKNKKKHSANGSKKHEPVEALPASTGTVAVSRGQQISVDKKTYEKELARLQVELVKLQEWVRTNKLKVVVIFEDATRPERAA